ncbi:hypothetical protein SDC9_207844 [bioreactor metagenome]|uniref:Uncharacterized protein n=1 Tax=bioreactor metagenome TaxID=1076179 RepID=A0A645JBH7_9ZZZZ
MKFQGAVEGDCRLAGEAYHAQAVGAVRSNFILDDSVVEAEHFAYVVSGFAVLTQNEDAVSDAVGKLLLLCVQVGESADVSISRIAGDHIALVDVLAVGVER